MVILSFMSLSMDLIITFDEKGGLFLVLQDHYKPKFTQRGCTHARNIRKTVQRI